MNPALTLLYAPGDKPERFIKALESGAHAVIFDLEDAVAAPHKDTARNHLKELFHTLQSTEHGYQNQAGKAVSIQIRINVAGSPWHDADTQLIRELPAWVGVRIPKVSSVRTLKEIAVKVGERDVFLLLENALGIEKAYDLAQALPNVKGLSLGEADLRSELGISGDQGLEYARSRIVYASRAAGLEAPTMAVYASVTDLQGLHDSCLAGKALGMLGRTAIHPKQLDTIVQAFAPTTAELEKAHKVLAAMENAQETGAGTAVLPDGTFLDAAMINLAKRTVALSNTQ